MEFPSSLTRASDFVHNTFTRCDYTRGTQDGLHITQSHIYRAQTQQQILDDPNYTLVRTNSSSDELEIERPYEDVTKVNSLRKTQLIIITSDFDAKIEQKADILRRYANNEWTIEQVLITQQIIIFTITIKAYTDGTHGVVNATLNITSKVYMFFLNKLKTTKILVNRNERGELLTV